MAATLLQLAKQRMVQYTSKHIILLLTALAFTVNVVGQTLPDSIVIIKKTYGNTRWFESANQDSLFKTEKRIFKKNVDAYDCEETSVDFSSVRELINEINNSDNYKNTLDRYRIDTTWIKNNPDKVLNLSAEATRYTWNKQQKAFLSKKLTAINNYNEGLQRYLDDGCCYTMHNNYRNEYVIQLYKAGQLTAQLISRKHIWGYLYPWHDNLNRELFSFRVEQILYDFWDDPQNITPPPLSGTKLLKKLTDRILQINADTLNKLAPYTYQTEIDELMRTFSVVSFEQITTYGGYHGDGPLIKVILKNPDMLSNVSIEFLASKHGNTIYSRDSVINQYQNLVKRVQAINFITAYLNANPNSNLHILYFDNKPINQYNIDGVNKNPEEWKKHDKELEQMAWIKKNNIKLSFDTVEARKTSERLYCGCNYRFPVNFINKAIMFIIDDEQKKHSRWLLLPDDTVLLYLTQGRNVEFNNYVSRSGFEYPCQRFNKSGNLVTKKE